MCRIKFQGQIFYVHERDKHSKTNWSASKVFNSNSRIGTIQPCHFASFVDLEREPWYFGALTRSDAENNLKMDPNKTGSYLIRYSLNNSYQNDKDKFHFYTLSVRDETGDIRHYKIFVNKDEQNRTLYSISPKIRMFKSIKELIDHFKLEDSEGLCATLKNPCVSEQYDVKFRYGAIDKKKDIRV